jgi:hypothetical protein
MSRKKSNVPHSSRSAGALVVDLRAATVHMLVAACVVTAPGCMSPEPSQRVAVQSIAAVPGITSSTVTYSTRPIGPDVVPFEKAEDYRSYIESLLASSTPDGGFCTDTVVNQWDNVSSQTTCGGPDGGFASRTRVDFFVSGDSTDNWQIQIGPDYGLGGAVFLDGVGLQVVSDDMWQGYGDEFLISQPMSAGPHVLEAYGMEDCCDGPTFGLYQSPGGPLQPLGQVSLCPSGLTATGSWTATNIPDQPLIEYTVQYDKISRRAFCDGVQVSSVCATISGSGWAAVNIISLTPNADISGYPNYSYDWSTNGLPTCESFRPNTFIGQAGDFLTLQVLGWSGPIPHRSSGNTQLN